MNNATIYTENGEILTEGLQSAAQCDAAKQAARDLAREVGRLVIVEDPETPHGAYGVTPDGETVAVHGWWSV